jgi:hypothetical protein
MLAQNFLALQSTKIIRRLTLDHLSAHGLKSAKSVGSPNIIFPIFAT